MNIGYVPNLSSAYYLRRKQEFEGKTQVDISDGVQGSGNTGNISGAGDNQTSIVPETEAEKIREMARKDAQSGTYMSEDYVKYLNDYKKEHISPDRDAMMSMLSSMITNGGIFGDDSQTISLPGVNCIAKIQYDAINGTSATVTDANGDTVLKYDASNGWVVNQTRAEKQWNEETRNIYAEAYEEARKEMESGQGKPQPRFEVRV